MRRIVAAGLVAVCFFTLVACVDSSTGEPARGNGEVDVLTWWAEGSEKASLDALVAVFASQHPGSTVVNGAVAGGAGTAAKAELQARIVAGDAPDTFQAHAGKELTGYIESGQLRDLSGLYDDFGIRKLFPADLLRVLQTRGQIYSIPVGIHRSNMVWSSTAVLTAAGLDPTAQFATIAEWISALDAIAANGATPLAVGTTWTQVNLLETVLMADLGAQGYQGLWDGTTEWGGAEVTAALADFDRLLSYSNANRADLDWPQATQLVIDGEAGFTVMGDWAVAAFEAHGKVAGADYTYFPVPGTAGIFGFLADSFTLPMGAPNPEGARAWLETVSSFEGQMAFNQVKGSIPARTDADPTDFSEYQRTAMTAYGRDEIVPSLAHGAAVRVSVLTAISAATAEFTSGSSDLAAFQADLAAAAVPLATS